MNNTHRARTHAHPRTMQRLAGRWKVSWRSLSRGGALRPWPTNQKARAIVDAMQPLPLVVLPNRQTSARRNCARGYSSSAICAPMRSGLCARR